jgi:hypothetical protein
VSQRYGGIAGHRSIASQDEVEMENRTLPEIALAENLPLDHLRAFLRKTPELGLLGKKYGPVRVYSPDEVRRIKEAFEVKMAGKSKRLEAVA